MAAKKTKAALKAAAPKDLRAGGATLPAKDAEKYLAKLKAAKVKGPGAIILTVAGIFAEMIRFYNSDEAKALIAALKKLLEKGPAPAA